MNVFSVRQAFVSVGNGAGLRHRQRHIGGCCRGSEHTARSISFPKKGVSCLLRRIATRSG